MDFDPLCRFLYFCGQLVIVAIIMIDSSKTRKLLAGVDVQSPYVIERCGNRVGGIVFFLGTDFPGIALRIGRIV